MMLLWIDNFISTILRWGMMCVFYLLAFIAALAEISMNFYFIFSEEFSFSAIDTLEFIGLVAFILVSVRFWKKGFTSGLKKRRRVYEYFKLIVFLSLMEALLFTFAVISLIVFNDLPSESDLSISMSEDLPAFWLLSLVLYAFAPTGKVKKKAFVSFNDTNESKIDETKSRAEVL
ncbi:MAG: hypothetical protein KBT79_09555 [Thalassolituus oleivorans]|nr:hypothetical protein [Thalassolituus oleivorans]